MTLKKQYEITIHTKEKDFIEMLDEAGVENATINYTVSDITHPEEVFEAVCDRYTSETDISRKEIRTMIDGLTMTVEVRDHLDKLGFIYSEDEYWSLRGINHKFHFTEESLANIIKADGDNLEKYDIIIDGVDISSIILSDYKEQIGIEDWSKCSEENAALLLELHRTKHGD